MTKVLQTRPRKHAHMTEPVSLCVLVNVISHAVHAVIRMTCKCAKHCCSLLDQCERMQYPHGINVTTIIADITSITSMTLLLNGRLSVNEKIPDTANKLPSLSS